VYAEARTILKAVITDFFFNCWCLEIRSDNRIRHVPRCIYSHAQNLDWKRYRISLFKVESGSHSCIPQVRIGLSIALYMRILLLVESFDFAQVANTIW
jgi:hypothetical protein